MRINSVQTSAPSVSIPAPLCAYLCVCLEAIGPKAGYAATHALCLALLSRHRRKDGEGPPELDIAELLRPDWAEHLPGPAAEGPQE